MDNEFDHRVLGERLDLFHMEPDAPGMVFWHPRGLAMLQALESAVRRVLRRDGFDEVRSPQLMRKPIWEASGHAVHFEENMYWLVDDQRPAAMKPVSCPAHLLMLRRRSLSYRDLPVRLCEFGLVHRNERSGSLHGLFRLRQFMQDDGHIACEEHHVAEEVARFHRSLDAFYRQLGFEDLRVAFSSRPASRAGSDEAWDCAERLLEEAAKAAGIELVHQPGEGAFYGPKLEIILRDRLGRDWQCGTIQVDMVLPERFDVAYARRDGERQRPVLLHRAMLGSLERFIAMVLEHHRGQLPGWLAPEQVRVAPIAEAQKAPAEAYVQKLRDRGLRAALADPDESLSKRVRVAHDDGVPFFVAIGPRDVDAGSVAIRYGDQKASLLAAEAVDWLAKRCESPA